MLTVERLALEMLTLEMLALEHKHPHILIVGAGYLGISLARMAIHAGWQVFAARRSAPSQEVKDSTPLVHWHQMDALDLFQVRETIHQIINSTTLDGIVYCVAAGGSSVEQYRQAYHTGLENILTVAPPSARVIVVSSTGVIPVGDGQWVDESYEIASDLLSAKYRAIYDGERMAMSRPDTVVVRLSGIYGPGRTRLVRLARDASRQMIVDEVAWTNRIHVEDASRALMHLLCIDRPSSLYHVTDNDPAAQHEVMAWLHRQCTGGTMSVHFEQNGIRLPHSAGLPESNKRIRNQLLLSTGFSVNYPTYREGYGPLCSKL